MERLTIKSASVEEYFKRGRETARRADAGVPIPKHAVLSFEDASEMLALLTPTRLKRDTRCQGTSGIDNLYCEPSKTRPERR